MIQSAYNTNIYGGMISQASPTAPAVSSPDAALSPQSAPPQADNSNLSAEALDGERGEDEERMNSLLQSMESWGDGSEGKAANGGSKQGGFFGKLLENANRARNSPEFRRASGAAGTQRANDPRQSRCQQAAGYAQSWGSGLGMFPGIPGAVGRAVQAGGSVMSMVGCPILESETVQRGVRRLEAHVEEAGRGATEMVYGQDYDQNGTPDWIEGNNN